MNGLIAQYSIKMRNYADNVSLPTETIMMLQAKNLFIPKELSDSRENVLLNSYRNATISTTVRILTVVILLIHPSYDIIQVSRLNAPTKPMPLSSTSGRPCKRLICYLHNVPAEDFQPFSSIYNRSVWQTTAAPS